jgi:hypothetical protein
MVFLIASGCRPKYFLGTDHNHFLTNIYLLDILNPEEGDSKFLRNVGHFLQFQHGIILRTIYSEYELPGKDQNSLSCLVS